MVVHVLHTVLTTAQAVVQALQLDKSSSDLELEPEEEAYVRDLLEQHLELTQVPVCYLLNPYMSSSDLELEPEDEAYVRDLLD